MQLAGRYTLQQRLSQDAQAAVWEGYDAALDRRVRIRVLRPELAGDAAAVEQFGRAARAAAARTDAPAGARVLDAGHDQSSGLPFVVFEWQAAPPAVEPPPPGQADATQRLPTASAGHRPPRDRAPRLVQRLALLLLLVPIVAGAFVVRGILDGPSPLSSVLERARQGTTPLLPTPAAAAQPTQRPTPAPAQPTPAPRPTPQVVPTATPGQIAGVRRRIVNTDGQGVALRASPGGQRLPGKGYDEGATVTLLEQDGAWAHIRGDDGREGWVLAVTLG